MEPTPDDLPFLVVHGPLVWKVTLACLVVAVLGLIRLIRHLRAARAARREIAALVIAAMTAVVGWRGMAALGDEWMRRCRGRLERLIGDDAATTGSA